MVKSALVQDPDTDNDKKIWQIKEFVQNNVDGISIWWQDNNAVKNTFIPSIKTYYFRISLQANTLTQVTADNIIEGSIPNSVSNSIYFITNVSNNNNYNYQIRGDGGKLYMKADITQEYLVRWHEIHNLIR